MAKQFALIGMGRFGRALALELMAMGHEVLAIDRNEKILDLIAPHVTHALQLNAADESALKSLGLRNFDVVVVSIGDDLRSSIMICMLAKDLGAQFVIAKSADELHSKILKKIGVDKVVFPETDMGVRLAHSIATSNVLDFIRLSDDYALSEVIIPNFFIGKTLSELNVRAKYGLNVAAVRTDGDLNVSPKANYVFKPYDVMVVIAENEDMIRFESKHCAGATTK